MTRLPPSRVTINQAAEISGLSGAEIYRRCVAGQIPSARQTGSAWSMLRRDAEKLTQRRRRADPRKPYMLRPVLTRAAAWEAEAKLRGLTVGTLAMQLLDAVSGWRDPVQRLSREEILARMDAIAELLGVGREEALARLERGELAGKLVEPELRMLVDMLQRMDALPTSTRLRFEQHDSWHRANSGESGTSEIYAEDRCCYCYRPTKPDAVRLRTARTNDGEWWLVGPDVDLDDDEWRDFQDYPGGRAPALLPVGPDCLRQHPEWSFAVVGQDSLGKPPLTPLPSHGHHMTWSEFVSHARSGGLTDDDGHAVFATETEASAVAVSPSEVGRRRPEWATHVVWFNR